MIRYGAPTHSLAEDLCQIAKVLEIDCFLSYMPEALTISFGDQFADTSTVRFLYTDQYVDLSKLEDVHQVCREVMRDQVAPAEAVTPADALEQLEEIWRKEPQHRFWFRVLLQACACAFVGPWGFQSQWGDLPIAFVLGGLVGVMQLWLASRPDRYTILFEVFAAALSSFLARAFGSIRGGRRWCFASLSQSSISSMLPGYLISCSILELLCRRIVAGSVRLVYGIIFSLSLGYGVTLGMTVYGAIEETATSEMSCRDPIPDIYSFLFVPLYILCVILLQQGRWRQVPVMLFISLTGYTVNHFCSIRFPDYAQISTAIAALTVGLMEKLYARFLHDCLGGRSEKWYSRYFRSPPAAIIIPALYVLVPSGLAAGGSLVSGITDADGIVEEHGMKTSERRGFLLERSTKEVDVPFIVYKLAYSMVQIAISVSVGLLVSSFLIYPRGKKRSAICSF